MIKKLYKIVTQLLCAHRARLFRYVGNYNYETTCLTCDKVIEIVRSNQMTPILEEYEKKKLDKS